MSAATVLRHTPPPGEAALKRRHRLWIMLGGGLGIVGAIALCANGLTYYILSADLRTKYSARKEISSGLSRRGGRTIGKLVKRK